MNLQFYIEKLNNSEEFENFQKENPDAFLSSGFFVLDFETNENKSSLDFYNPKTGKMFGFQLNGGVKLIPLEMMQNSQIPLKLNADFDIDFKYIEATILKEMANQKITNKLQKIIIIFQNYENKDFVFCTVFLSGFGILKVHFDDKRNIVLFEKKTLFDFVKKA
jgi:hypothetical protein